LRSLSHVQVRERQRVSAVSVLGFAAVAAVAVLILLSYVQLTELSTSVVKLKSRMAALETQNVTLTAQYEKMYDLSTVKETAEAAGMAKPSGSQIYYVDLSDGDSATVYQTEEPGILNRLLASLSHGVYAVVEYFD
jgi:cell division protein FtsL